jgi:hypothetical protein
MKKHILLIIGFALLIFAPFSPPVFLWFCELFMKNLDILSSEMILIKIIPCVWILGISMIIVDQCIAFRRKYEK